MLRNLVFSPPSLLLPTVPAGAAAFESLDFWTLSFFMTVNFLVTAGLFGLGVLIIGLFYDHVKPWFVDRRAARRDRKKRYSARPHPNP